MRTRIRVLTHTNSSRTENKAWIGGDFGLTNIDLSRNDMAFRHLPKLYIREIILNNDSLFGSDLYAEKLKRSGKSIRFGSDIKGIRFLYASDACSVIKASSYTYYLEGYESQWSAWTNVQQREYTNLSSGTYTFHVKTMDMYGRESEEKTFTFQIEKPFYLKWYSLLAYVLVSILSIWLFFVWRTRVLIQKNEHLEQIIEERTSQIRSQRDEIAEKSQKLETTLIDLSQAQDDLIRQEKMAMIGKLTQGLIDRILNPLNYIINFSHLSIILLKDMKENVEEEKEQMSKDTYEDSLEVLRMMDTHLHKIENHGNSTSRILKAMEEMLSDHSCYFTTTDINHLCCINMDILRKYYEKEISELPIQFKTNLLPEQLMIDADAVKLGKVLLSLLQNAFYAIRKKMEKKPYDGLLSLTMECEKDIVIIKIMDNGIGIEDHILDKIFDPFFTTKTTAEAAGVGLYLSREILLNHKGSIDIKSKKDEFTEFIITLPIHQETKKEE